MSSRRHQPTPENATTNAFSNPTLSALPRLKPKSPFLNTSPLTSPTSPPTSPSNRWSSSKPTSPMSEERQMSDFGGIRVETSTVASAESGMKSNPSSPRKPISPAARRFQHTTALGVEEMKRKKEAAKEARDEGGSIPSKPTPPKYPHYVPRDPNMYASTTPKNGDNSSVGSNGSVASRRSLDLMQNDNAFHVIANLLVERLAKCVKNYGDTSLYLDVQDVANLDKMVPMPVRRSFIKALRYRLKHNCPPDSELGIHILTRQCREFGLDREGKRNPLLALVNGQSLVVTNLPAITAIPRTVRPTSSFSSKKSRQSKDSATRPPLSPSVNVLEVENQALRTQLEEQRKQIRVREQELIENASVASALTHPSVEISTNESLAKKQIMAELREASALMAESQTPEASEFWKNHVLSLQSRLKELHSQDANQMRSSNGSNHSGSGKTPTSDEMKQWKPIAEAGYAPPTYSNNMYKDQQKAQGTQKLNTTPKKSEPLLTAAQKEEPMKELVSVVSPADLPGGYHFEAEIDGRRFLAVVPVTGVQKGQTFKCPMRPIETTGPTVPRGAWKDGILSCFSLGVTHPLIWNTVTCAPLVLGQVMTRLSLDVLGRRLRTRVDTWKTTVGVVSFWAIMNILIIIGHRYKMTHTLALIFPDMLAFLILNIVMGGWFIHAVAKTRQALREKYDIREESCIDLEDYAYAAFCAPCAIGQMARHTAPYEDGVQVKSCSRTGLDEEAIDLGYLNNSSS